MKVYVVEAWMDFDRTDFKGVYSSESEAKKAADYWRALPNYYDGVEYYETEVYDEWNPETQA